MRILALLLALLLCYLSSCGPPQHGLPVETTTQPSPEQAEAWRHCME